jgi:hypothetical protein
MAIGELLLPLGTGPLIGRFFRATRRWIPAIQQASSRLFLLCLVGCTVLGWSHMTSIIRESTLTAIVILSVCGLAAGLGPRSRFRHCPGERM